MFTKKGLQKFIDDKYITVHKHPTEDLYIYNYTAKAQYDKVWTEETMNCRGLILDGSMNVVARPFKKFFNYEELKQEDIPKGKYRLFEKMDGSLGILYWIGDVPYLATRGSFTSDQAIKGTEMLRKMPEVFLNGLNRKFTYLFEIIYPQNRIVVDYGGREELVLLAVIDNKTGKNAKVEDLQSVFKMPLLHGSFPSWNEKSFTSVAIPDATEGFVIEWENGFRAKMKSAEYVRLHRLLTQCTARSIWDCLRRGDSTRELIERVPDEFYKWVKRTTKEIQEKYEEIYKYAKERAQYAKDTVTIDNELSDKKDLSYSDIEMLQNKFRGNVRKLFTQKSEYEAICWLFYYKTTKAKIREQIFKLIYPAHEKPFVIDEDL